MGRALDVFETDAIDENVRRKNVRRRFEANLPGQGNVFVLIRAPDKNERILCPKTRDRSRRAVARNTNAAHEVPAFVKG